MISLTFEGCVAGHSVCDDLHLTHNKITPIL